MSLLGFDALGRMALGQIRTAAPSTIVFASMNSSGAALASMLSAAIAAAALSGAGISNVAPRGASKTFASMVGSGSATLAPVLTAKVSAVVTAQGNSSMQGSNNPAAVAQFAGSSAVSAVSYVFYADVEKAGPAFEARTAAAVHENRCAVAPYEDRVYYTKSKPPSLGPANRRRTL